MSATPSPTLAEVAHAQSDELCNVVALLEGAQMLMAPDEGGSVARLISQALSRLNGVVTAFDRYI